MEVRAKTEVFAERRVVGPHRHGAGTRGIHADADDLAQVQGLAEFAHYRHEALEVIGGILPSQVRIAGV